MLHSLKIKLDNEKLAIFSAGGVLLANVPCAVILDEHENFLGIGDMAETGKVRSASPEYWEKLKDKVHVRNPFSVLDFRPELAAAAISQAAYLTTHATARLQKRWLKDSMVLHLQIPGYADLKPDMQELFEYLLQESRYMKVESLSINDHSKPLEKIRLAKSSAYIGVILMPLSLYLLAFLLAQTFLGEQFSAPIPKEKETQVFVIIVGAVVFVTYLSLIIVAVIWRYAARRMVSDPISRRIIEGAKILPKQLLNLIWQDSPSKSA